MGEAGLDPTPMVRQHEVVVERTVISLDPGRLSGVVNAAVRRGKLDIQYFHEVEFTPKSLYQYLYANDPSSLIVERFTYRPKHRTEDKLDLYPCYLLGVCYLYTEQRPECKLIQQEASQAKGGYYGRDTTLSELGVYCKGGKGHARDATRHILYWFYEGAGFSLNSGGVVDMGLTKDMQTEKQKNPKRGKRNTGEISF